MRVDEATLEQACADTLVSESHEALVNRLTSLYSGKPIDLADVNNNWYRVGGLVDDEGNKVSDNLREWVEAQDEDDVISLMDKYAGEEFFVTRIVGKTYYLVIPHGDDPLNYTQIEVDEVREVVDRMLFDLDNLADDFEDLIDPIEYTKIEEHPIGHPRYQLKSVRNMFDVRASMAKESRFKRFYEEWKASSADGAGHFSDFWVLNFSRHKGAFGELSTEITPISRQASLPSDVDVTNIESGQPLARIIHTFDREVGYPMAWYFFMLTTKKNFHKLAEVVHDDLMGAYAYLPAKDIKILKGWIADPYCFY